MNDKMKAQGEELTFHSALLQALHDRTDGLMRTNALFTQSVKMTGKRFKEEIDKKLTYVYAGADSEELEEHQLLNELICKKIDEAHIEYRNRLTK